MEVQKDEVKEAKKVTHFVYPYRLGKEMNIYDLQYSIRSIYKHFKEPFDVTIIGELPYYLDEFKEGLKYIPLPPLGDKPQINITNAQIVASCLYDEFMDMNDDFIFVNDFVVDDFRHLYSLGVNIKQNKDTAIPIKSYGHKLKNCQVRLTQLSKPTVNYACHLPVVLNSKMFLDMVRDCDLHSLMMLGGIPSDVMYQNFYFDTLVKTQEERLAKYIRIGIWGRNLQKIQQLKTRSKDIKILNFDESGFRVNPYIGQFLKENYSKPSPLERDENDNNK